MYRDTPIIRRASALSGGEPPEYRLMRKLGATFDRAVYTESRIFVEQARLMASFEDHWDKSEPFTSFFPTYRVMTLPQMRTYFTWRTAFRRGEAKPPSVSYAMVCAFEIINLIGVASPEEAYAALSRLIALMEGQEGFSYLARNWLRDIVIYYGLPRSMLPEEERRTSELLQPLFDPDGADDETLFASITAFSTFDPANSRYYRTDAAGVKAVSAAVYRAMHAFFAARRKKPYVESLFEPRRSTVYAPFSGAVFYDARRTRAYSYETSPLCRYAAMNGRWFCSAPPGGVTKSRALGALLRNVDSRLRDAAGFPYPTKAPECAKQLVSEIDRAIGAYLKQKKQAEARVISFDFSVLDQIRSASDRTRERILTEEERSGDAPAPAPETALPPPETPTGLKAPAPVPAAPSSENPASSVPAAPQKPEAQCPLTEAQLLCLKLLLRGEDPAPRLRELSEMLSVTVEAINEALFEEFADCVVDFSGDRPVIVEDYREELEGAPWLNTLL